MRAIVGSSLKFRFIVIAFAVAMMIYGLSRIPQMPVDVFPEFAPPLVEIQTITLGLSPEETESLVTIPLEQSLQGVQGLKVMRSKSVEQLSSIKLIFEQGTDLIRARQEVQERIGIVTPTLPTWAAPPFMMQPLSATSRVMKIGMTSDKYSVIDMSMTTYWKIRERLLKVPGVANIAIWGERIEMFQVQVEPERLKAYGVSLDQVMEATSDSLDVGLLQYASGSLIGKGGFIETPNQRIGVEAVLPIISPDDLAKIAVTVDKNGNIVRLEDVSNVVIGHQPLIGDAVINDGPGLMLIVEKFPWGNTLGVTRGVEAAIEEMKPGLKDITFDTAIFRPATFVELSLENLLRAMLIGSVLVIVILIAFLYEWRVALISVIAIPLSLMAALLVLYFRGTTINVMILAGLIIALGELVDDAIIDVENIVRRLRQARQEGRNISTARIILESSMEVRSAIVFATLIVVVSISPVFFMEGLAGAFFRPLALSYVLSILASLVVALTVTPALCLIMLRNFKSEQHESPFVPALKRGYQNFLSGLLRRPVLTSALTFSVLAVAGLLIWPRMHQELLPSFQERDFLMHFLTKPGTSLEEEVRITTQSSKELRAIPGVNNFGAHIGQALQADEVYGVYFGENWISVDPKVNYDDTVNAIQATVDGYPGLIKDVQTYLKERIREVLTGSSHPVVIRIFGPELPVLREKADEVKQALEKVEGLTDLHVELVTEIPQIDVKVNLEAAQKYGLKPGDVRRAAATLIAGEEVGDIHTSNRTYDVNVWSTPETRRSLTDLRNLPIDTPDGSQVPLSEIADITIIPTPNSVNRENSNRRINVDANVSGRDLSEVVADVQNVLDEIDFPLEYYPVLLGEYAELQAAQARLRGFALAAIIAVFFLLVTAFNSGKLAFLSLIALLAALVGGLLAAFITGGVISLGSLVGFLTILGIAARNGIMMISHFQHLEKYEGEAFGLNLVLRGAKERLVPVLMTSLTAGLALVPLVVAGKIAGHEIEHPMAIVILGGLLTSTLVNLFVLPALYLKFGQVRVRSSVSNVVPQPA
jgi:CzcA family heavy metal efflux pump